LTLFFVKLRRCFIDIRKSDELNVLENEDGKLGVTGLSVCCALFYTVISREKLLCIITVTITTWWQTIVYIKYEFLVLDLSPEICAPCKPEPSFKYIKIVLFF